MKTELIFTTLLILVSSLSKYKVTDKQIDESSYTFELDYFGSEAFYVKNTSNIIKQLKFEFKALSPMDFHIKITDSKNKRFEVPQGGVFPTDTLANKSSPISSSAFNFSYTENPFDFRVFRKVGNVTLFSSYEGELIFSEYYLQIKTDIPGQQTYGLGERFNQHFRLPDGKWTIFNRGRGKVIDQGTGMQTYGYYPMYLQREPGNNFHINYFRSSNAMDVIRETKLNKTYLTYKVIGGIFDFRFFLGKQNPEILIQNFQSSYIGASAIPPFWSFGFHQSRWGYTNISIMESVLRSYEANSLPLDTIWSDIDYMLDFEDFTINEDLFPLDRMQKITNKYRYIPIIDAGIKVNNGLPYEEGKKRGVFIQDANGSELIGKVWPGSTTFVDFFHPNATQYWGDMLDLLYRKVNFSGIWLDMNEYANFCDGPCETPSVKIFDYSHDLPYNPGSDSIEAHTISLNSTHYGNLKEADVHVFGAFLETYATNVFLKKKNLRPFIITRSSTFGTNKYGFHWTGDNSATFDFLRCSISDNFINQLWGFQMVGPDICGFGGNTTEELCSRWFQLGALYPFARNHNEHKAISQEPFALGQIVLKSAKTNLKLRYSLLKFYFSQFILQKGFGSIFKPIFFSLPSDNQNYVDDVADTQFLIGNDLMAAPILEEGVKERDVYFSTYSWVDIYSGKRFNPGTSKIGPVELTDPLPLFLRENSIILTQNSEGVLSTKDLNSTFEILSAFYYSAESNETHKVFIAGCSHISLRDYNNNEKIDLCLSKGCIYIWNLKLFVESNRKSLSVRVDFSGNGNLAEQIEISKFILMYNGEKIVKELEEPLIVKGSLETVIMIEEPETILEDVITE